MKGSFASDNMTGLSVEILAAITAANEKKYCVPYGSDPDFTGEALRVITEEVLGGRGT